VVVLVEIQTQALVVVLAAVLANQTNLVVQETNQIKMQIFHI
jgi:competence protein ComGF